jgi:hypothetical protein
MPEFSSSVKKIRAEDARCSMLDACACRFGTFGLGRKSSEEKE